MNHRMIVGVALLALGLFTPAATPAFAAAPIGGSPYVGEPYVLAERDQAAARLVVSRDGKTLVPRRGAFVSAYSRCANGREGGANVALSSPARIRGAGSFRLVERQGETDAAAARALYEALVGAAGGEAPNAGLLPVAAGRAQAASRGRRPVSRLPHPPG